MSRRAYRLSDARPDPDPSPADTTAPAVGEHWLIVGWDSVLYTYYANILVGVADGLPDERFRIGDYPDELPSLTALAEEIAEWATLTPEMRAALAADFDASRVKRRRSTPEKHE